MAFVLGFGFSFFSFFLCFPVSIFLGWSCHDYCQGCILSLPYSDLSVRTMMELGPTASAAVSLSPTPVWVVVDGSAPDLQAGVWLKRNRWLCLTSWSIVSSLDSLVFPWQFTPSPHFQRFNSWWIQICLCQRRLRKENIAFWNKNAGRSHFVCLGAPVDQWQAHTLLTLHWAASLQRAKGKAVQLGNRPWASSPTISARLFSIFLFPGPNSPFSLARVYMLQIAPLEWGGVLKALIRECNLGLSFSSCQSWPETIDISEIEFIDVQSLS